MVQGIPAKRAAASSAAAFAAASSAFVAGLACAPGAVHAAVPDLGADTRLALDGEPIRAGSVVTVQLRGALPPGTVPGDGLRIAVAALAAPAAAGDAGAAGLVDVQRVSRWTVDCAQRTARLLYVADVVADGTVLAYAFGELQPHPVGLSGQEATAARHACPAPAATRPAARPAGRTRGTAVRASVER